MVMALSGMPCEWKMVLYLNSTPQHPRQQPREPHDSMSLQQPPHHFLHQLASWIMNVCGQKNMSWSRRKLKQTQALSHLAVALINKHKFRHEPGMNLFTPVTLKCKDHTHLFEEGGQILPK